MIFLARKFCVNKRFLSDFVNMYALVEILALTCSKYHGRTISNLQCSYRLNIYKPQLIDRLDT